MLRISRDRGFTMLELIVSVGLMVVLLTVLAFVFRQSAEAVSQATEAVNTVQKARNFEARVGRDLASAVEFVVEGGGLEKPKRAFWFDDDPEYRGSQGNPEEADYTTSIEFVSRSMQDGVLRTWDVKYVFTKDMGKKYGAIRRLKDTTHKKPDGSDSGEYVLWDHEWEPAAAGKEQGEVLAWPVKDVTFEAAGNWNPLDLEGEENTDIPPYVRASVTFLDTWGGETFKLPMQFYFPIYQGD